MTRKVLLIDENVESAGSNANLLRSRGYNVTVCTDIYRARGVADIERDRYQFVIYSLNTTEAGVRQIDLLRQKQPNAKIFVYSSADELRRYQREISEAEAVSLTSIIDADHLVALLQ